MPSHLVVSLIRRDGWEAERIIRKTSHQRSTLKRIALDQPVLPDPILVRCPSSLAPPALRSGPLLVLGLGSSQGRLQPRSGRVN